MRAPSSLKPPKDCNPATRDAWDVWCMSNAPFKVVHRPHLNPHTGDWTVMDRWGVIHLRCTTKEYADEQAEFCNVRAALEAMRR